MIIGTGIDLVHIPRIEQVFAKRGDRFARHVLHNKEYDEFEKTKYPGRLLAKRFAVKEAATKALGTGQAQDILLRHFYILHNEQGRPLLYADDQAQRLCEQLGINAMHVSITDEEDYAMASVILEKI